MQMAQPSDVHCAPLHLHTESLPLQEREAHNLPGGHDGGDQHHRRPWADSSAAETPVALTGRTQQPTGQAFPSSERPRETIAQKEHTRQGP